MYRVHVKLILFFKKYAIQSIVASSEFHVAALYKSQNDVTFVLSHLVRLAFFQSDISFNLRCPKAPFGSARR
ncbi:hypothetical protein QQP08_017600 [Theobroma cacao]|nr:hypothetical protein QQP08_017600 [Theobroma cacao]